MQNNGIRLFSNRCTLKSTWWPLTLILTIYVLTQLSNRAKSVQECLLISIVLVTSYSTNMPANYVSYHNSKTYLMTFDAKLDLHWGHQTWQEGEFSSGMSAAIEKPSCPVLCKSTHKSYNYLSDHQSEIHLMTFDSDFDLIWDQSTGQLDEISQERLLLMSISLVAPYFTKWHTNPKIISQTTTLKCTWWPLTPILTLYEVTKLGNRAKSVQECLQKSIRLVAPYAAKVPTNPKITSQTTSLKRHFSIYIVYIYRGQYLLPWKRTDDILCTKC